MRRLGSEAIDLYVHRIDPRWPIEETVGTIGAAAGVDSDGMKLVNL